MADNANTTRRNFLSVAPVAVLAATIPAQAAADEISPELQALIDGKQRTYTAHIAALDAFDRARDAHFATHPGEYDVPLVIGGSQRVIVTGHDLDHCCEEAADAVRWRYARDVFAASKKAWPDKPELIAKVWESGQRRLISDIENIKTIVECERKARKQSGFQQALDAYGEASDADIDARLAICEYPCRNTAEWVAKGRALAKWAGSEHGGLEQHELDALFLSMITA